MSQTTNTLATPRGRSLLNKTAWLAGFAIAAASLNGPVAASDSSFSPGPLSEASIGSAAQAAGFEVQMISTDIPVAARSRIPFETFEYEDPLLVDLREKYPLRDVVSEGPDALAKAPSEWATQLLLMDWVHRQIPIGTPQQNVESALDILRLSAQGNKFWCTHTALTYVECAQALGWQARKLGIDRLHGSAGLGSSHHGVAEVWSNDYRKWVLIDPLFNLHFEKQGEPLSAWEIRAEWLKNEGSDVDRVVGVPPNAVKKNPAMNWRFYEDETSRYFWMYIHVRASSDGPHPKFIFLQDEHNAGKIWYQNSNLAGRSRLHFGYRENLSLPTDRYEDAYWTVGVIEANVDQAHDGQIQLSLESYCPNLVAYEITQDGKTWETVDNPKSVRWRLKKEWNVLQLRTLSKGGVIGPETSVVMQLKSLGE